MASWSQGSCYGIIPGHIIIKPSVSSKSAVRLEFELLSLKLRRSTAIKNKKCRRLTLLEVHGKSKSYIILELKPAVFGHKGIHHNSLNGEIGVQLL